MLFLKICKPLSLLFNCNVNPNFAILYLCPSTVCTMYMQFMISSAKRHVIALTFYRIPYLFSKTQCHFPLFLRIPYLFSLNTMSFPPLFLEFHISSC